MSMQEVRAWRINGFFAFVTLLAVLLAAAALIVTFAPERGSRPAAPFFGGLALAVCVPLIVAGFYTVQPNAARVLTFLGRYTGSVRDQGFWWSNPFALKKPVSLRVRNFNSEKLKVNDAHGNPIEIAAVVNWKVIDSARALFDVDKYEEFVSIQSETAIRTLASHYPYDSHEDGKESLRDSPEEVARELCRELQERLTVAGVDVLEARISHLAYSPEIAQAMLRRQQAQAVIAARQQIVEGAVGMVEMALRRLSEHNVIALDEERKAQMVSNLMMVLVSETEAQPVINAGNLY